MDLINYKKEFDSRHDWDDGELNILQSKWPQIKFKNIPQAWIIPIENFLLKSNLDNIKEIRQEYGQLIVSNDKMIENRLDSIIKKIDMDLW